MRARASFRLLPAALAASLLALAAPVAAHNLTLTDTLALLKTDGTFQVDLTLDLDAMALGVGPERDVADVMIMLRQLPPAELAAKAEALCQRLERAVIIRFDGKAVAPVVSLPEHGTKIADQAFVPTILGTTARLAGRVPFGARAVTVQVSGDFPPAVLTLLDQATARGERFPLAPGEESPPWQLRPDSGGSGEAPRGAARLEVAGRYLVLGFWHIVPEGLDHILFVLGLFLLAARWRPLLWQVTAFTAAHTVSLALATLGLVTVPARIVEPLIALSIAYVAVENTLTAELQPWRPVVVFFFGLFHGLGFAGVLAELGLPAGERLAALLSFNAGVELGQLFVLAAAFALLGVLRARPWYRRRIVIPLSLAIAAVGLYWAITRAL